MGTKIKVAQQDGEITYYNGEDKRAYQVKNGEVVVDDEHAAAILNATQGTRVPETPAKE